MKKILSFASAVILILSVFSVSAFAYDTYVDDFADLFSDDEINLIEEAVESFASETDFSVAVVTTDDALGKTSQEYADDYYDSLIFNSGWSENGLLFLIDMDNREVYISTAGECILTYSDSSVDYIIDSGYNDLVSGYYADCVLAMLETAANEYENYSGGNYYIPDEEDYSYGDSEFSDSVVQFDGEWYEVSSDGEWVPVDEYNYDYGYDYGYNSGSRNRSGFEWSHVLAYIIIALVIAAIAVFAVKSRYKNMGKGDEFDADDITLNLTNSSDNIISRNVVTTRIPRNNNHNRPGGRSGGFSGGSSVHRSGGGIRHGGGGRKF